MASMTMDWILKWEHKLFSRETEKLLGNHPVSAEKYHEAFMEVMRLSNERAPEPMGE